MLPWIICVILLTVLIILIFKIALMRKSMREIYKGLQEHLSADTNQLITISSGDRYIRELAEKLNRELTVLRKQRRKYVNGDRELKDAVTNISHDLRTPLTAICGYLDLLEQEEKSEAVARYIEQIRDRSEALKSLTEELFRYSVITSADTLEPTRIDLRRALEESLISFYGAMRQRGITPVIDLPSNAVWRDLDDSALSRVFGNMIGNAVKYSDGDLSVKMTEDGVITFSNTAKELSSVDVQKLFDRFYTVNSARKSTGLGLSIAKLLAERMNGIVTADYRAQQLYITVSFP